MAGELVVDPDLALAALSEGSNPLTPRERDILAASLFGASLAEIAARLVLSEGTVGNHLSTAMQKLGAQNRMEAARLAEQKGMVVKPRETILPESEEPTLFLLARSRWLEYSASPIDLFPNTNESSFV
jgi:DNA-binding CsgD family transcriptional regulator